MLPSVDEPVIQVATYTVSVWTSNMSNISSMWHASSDIGGRSSETIETCLQTDRTYVVSPSQVCGADSQHYRLITGFCSYPFPPRVWPIKRSLHTGVDKLSVGGLLQYFLIALAQFSQHSFNEENSEPNWLSRFFPLNTKSCPECKTPHVQSSEYRQQFLFLLLNIPITESRQHQYVLQAFVLVSQ